MTHDAHQLPNLGLKAACAAGSFSGWLGRAFCRESPSSRRMRPIDVTCRLLANPLLANAHQILAREGRKAARLRSRPVEHEAIEFGLLLSVELRRAPITRPVGKPIEAVLVVADDPVAQRLAVHACRLRRRLPAHAVERIGNRQDAPCNARIALALGEFA